MELILLPLQLWIRVQWESVFPSCDNLLAGAVAAVLVAFGMWGEMWSPTGRAVLQPRHMLGFGHTLPRPTPRLVHNLLRASPNRDSSVSLNIFVFTVHWPLIMLFTRCVTVSRCWSWLVGGCVLLPGLCPSHRRSDDAIVPAPSQLLAHRER